jgi:vancomycin resistance protein YoaR
MTDQTEDIKSADFEPVARQLVKPRRRQTTSPSPQFRLWVILAPCIFVAILGAFYAYLSVAGIEPSWAVGTSTMVTPPGAKVAGYDIGGKNLDELNTAISTVVEEFAKTQVWLAENPSHLSQIKNDPMLSNSPDDLCISVAATDLGLTIDTDLLRNDLASFNGPGGLLAIGKRIEMWNAPPDIPIKLKVDQFKARAKLEKIKKSKDHAPINAMMELDSHKIQPSKSGFAIDLDSTLANIPDSTIGFNDIAIQLVVKRTEPSVKEDDFKGIDVTTPLATFTSKFNTGKGNRSKNIGMIAKHFKEVVVGPGEVFSFNKVTGPRTEAQGYLPAPMYIGNRVELSPAGGACQVSTTLYNTALLAGMDIVERHPHSRPCTYVPYGQDAAVAYDSGVDFKFKNSLKHAIIINPIVDASGGHLTFEIFGNPEDRVKVAIHNAYTLIPRPDSSTRYIVDTSLAPGKEVVEDGGCNGIDQRAWRVWFDSEGNEVRTEQLSKDHLNPIGKVIRHNPSAVVPEGNPETPAPPVDNPDSPPQDPPPPPPGANL